MADEQDKLDELKRMAEANPPDQVLEDVDRITANINVYHEHHGEQPHPAASAFSAFLETIEQPYGRRVRLQAGEPVALETGWVERVGMVLIENRTGKAKKKNPTEEEKADIAKRVVRVTAGGGPGWIVRPGRFMFVEVEDASSVMLQCLHETADLYLNIFPR